MEALRAETAAVKAQVEAADSRLQVWEAFCSKNLAIMSQHCRDRCKMMSTVRPAEQSMLRT